MCLAWTTQIKVVLCEIKNVHYGTPELFFKRVQRLMQCLYLYSGLHPGYIEEMGSNGVLYIGRLDEGLLTVFVNAFSNTTARAPAHTHTHNRHTHTHTHTYIYTHSDC